MLSTLMHPLAICCVVLSLGQQLPAARRQSAHTSSPQTNSDLGIGESLVYIYPPDATFLGPDFLGTGFFITQSGTVLTAAHVVPGDACILQLATTTGTLAVFADVRYRHEQRDLAVLVPCEPLPARVRPLRFSSVPFPEKRNYFIPILFALDHSWPEHKVSTFEAFAVAIDDDFLYLDAKLPGGASGGPVIDDQGRVGAVIVSTRAFPMQLGRPIQNATTGSLKLSDPDTSFFVLKAQRLESADIESMLNESQSKASSLRSGKR
ncbi:MAG: S1 family peptidase [Candidatus Sumerlaeaceae bacterium]